MLFRSQRTDVCDFPYSGSATVRVVDTGTTREVASQLIIKDGKRFLRVLAADVPSVGYKVYEVQPGNPGKLPDVATLNGSVFENAFYKLTATGQGVITSIIDKRNGNKEFVSSVNGRFMNDLGAGSDDSGTITVVNAGPVPAPSLSKP